jgi:cytochrome b involved in lipid metabolism
VCDITKYLNDHPGGAEIMLEFAGKNADDMFEDIGHSAEARETLKGLIIGECPVSIGVVLCCCFRFDGMYEIFRCLR